MSRNKTSRQQRILAELEQTPSLRVNELAELMDVSPETIRRDLDALSHDGLIDRTYGGALRRRPLEPNVSERHTFRVAERESMARRARPLLGESRHLMIGSGATTMHMARRIAVEMKNVTVIAHSFGVATVLSLNPTITVLMAPGIYHPGEGGMYGSATIRFLQDFRVDWAILGASGLTPDGPADALIESADVYAMMMRQATHTLLLADSGKFGGSFPARWAKWTDIDALATDAEPDGELREAILAGGTRIHCA